MKAIFTYLLILFCFSRSNAQDQFPPMEGIGKFKVNAANLSLVEEISQELKCKVNLINSFEAYYQFSKDSPKIYQIAPYDKSFSSNPPHSPNCQGVEVFYINKYTVSSIPMSEVFLTFKDGLLVQFQCEPTTEFREAIKLKYGSGQLETVNETVKCVTKLTGITTEYEANKYYQKWATGNISATLTLATYYNDKCQKRYINSFLVKDSLVMKDISECESTNRKEAMQAKEQEQKKKLSDF